MTEEEKINPIKPSVKTEENKEDLKPVAYAEVLTDKEKKDRAMVDRDAAASGVTIDWKKYTHQPITPETKTDIEGAVRNMAAGDLARNVKGFSDLYGKPPQQELPKLDTKQLQEDARRQRKARWADALVAFGEGLQGKVANPEMFRSTQIQRKRDAQFQEYKNITQKNQLSRELWNKQRSDDLLKFIKDKIDDQTLTASEREKYQIAYEQIAQRNRETALGEAELAARKDNSYYDKRPRGTRTSTTRKPEEKFISIYDKASGGNQYVLNKLAEINGFTKNDNGETVELSPANAERMAGVIINNMFTKNDNGEYEPIPGRENYISEIENRLINLEKLEEENAQGEPDYDGLSRREKRAAKAAWENRKSSLPAEIEKSRKELQNLIQGKSTQTPKPEPTNSKLEEFFN